MTECLGLLKLGTARATVKGCRVASIERSCLVMRIDLVLTLSCLVACSGTVVRSNPEGDGGNDSVGQGAGAARSMNDGGSTLSDGGRANAGGAFTTSGTTATGGAAAGSGGTPDPQRCDGAPNPTPLQALSSWEYERSVLALTQHAVTADLPQDPVTDGTFAWSMDLSFPVFRLLFDEAEAQGAVARNLALAPCDPVVDGEAVCAQAFVDELVSRAFRRPLSDAERKRYLELFELGRAAAGFATGVELVVEAALLSPMFLHKLYLGSEGNGAVTPLTPFEVASRLSYLFSGAPPDQALLSAAADGDLLTQGSVEAEARRLMTKPAFDDTVRHFHAQWLGLDSLRFAQGPGLTPQLLTSMRTETEHFIDYVFHDGERSFPALLQAPVGFIDSNLAPRYGVNDPGTPFAKVALDPNRYFGLLTQASTLTRFPNPTYRGKFVREQLLCMRLPAPPADIDTTVEIQPGETRRQAWLRHQADPACAGCHRLVDPIGFGFENFDEGGIFRVVDNGLPVDASGELISVEEIGLFVESRGSMKASVASPDTALAARDRCGVSRAEAGARRRFLWAEAVMLPWREASGDQGPRSA